MELLLATALPQSAGPSAAGGLAMAADVAMILIGIFAAVGTVLGLLLLAYLRRVGRSVERVAHSLRGRTDPLLDHGRGIAANVEFITATIRTDVEALNTSVKALSDRLTQASDRMEERIEEFNALMEVVQGEAEDVFLDTAATVRGVKAGAASLGRGRGGTVPARRPDDFDEDTVFDDDDPTPPATGARAPVADPGAAPGDDGDSEADPVSDAPLRTSGD